MNTGVTTSKGELVSICKQEIWSEVLLSAHIIEESGGIQICKMQARHRLTMVLQSRAREIVGFAGSGPIFETENRFISRQEA